MSNGFTNEEISFMTDLGLHYGTAFYDDESSWENGALYIENFLIQVKVRRVELEPVQSGVF